MNDKATIEASLRILGQRIRDVERVFGTLTDKTRLSGYDTPPNCPHISKQDLAAFRWVVQNGIVKTPEFAGPSGWEVLGFLTLLNEMQDAEIVKSIRKTEEEMIFYATFSWLRLFEEHEGNLRAAKEAMRNRAGNANNDFKSLYNKAYQVAKAEYGTVR